MLWLALALRRVSQSAKVDRIDVVTYIVTARAALIEALVVVRNVGQRRHTDLIMSHPSLDQVPCPFSFLDEKGRTWERNVLHAAMMTPANRQLASY